MCLCLLVKENACLSVSHVFLILSLLSAYMKLQGDNEKVKLEPLISEGEASEAINAAPVGDSTALTPQISRLMEAVQVMFKELLMTFSVKCSISMP